MGLPSRAPQPVYRRPVISDSTRSQSPERVKQELDVLHRDLNQLWTAMHAADAPQVPIHHVAEDSALAAVGKKAVDEAKTHGTHTHVKKLRHCQHDKFIRSMFTQVVSDILRRTKRFHFDRRSIPLRAMHSCLAAGALAAFPVWLAVSGRCFLTILRSAEHQCETVAIEALNDAVLQWFAQSPAEAAGVVAALRKARVKEKRAKANGKRLAAWLIPFPAVSNQLQ